MEKLEKVFMLTVLLAGIGIVTFWGAGFKGEMNLSLGSFIFAGIMAWIGLIARTILWFKKRRMGIY